MIPTRLTKAGLVRKRDEIHKALCVTIKESYFKPLYNNVLCWESWNKLHAMAEAMSCDMDHILLIEECLMYATKQYLGDVC